ncbi:MAG: HD domain-containing protein [Lachnospiraceae bacterium]|nr:HD domain-containing protein [Lachnospiraceae bacterium]
MIPLIYMGILAVSLLCSTIYVYIWHKHFDVNFSMIFTIVPISCIGYLFFSLSKNLGEALFAQKIIYIGGCFLQLFILFGVFNLCGIVIKKWIKLLLFVLCTLFYLSVLTAGYTDLFYGKVSFKLIGNTPVLIKEYLWLHTVFQFFVIFFFLIVLITICYSWFKQRQVPRTIIHLLLIPEVICIACYFVGKVFSMSFDPVPLGYVLAQLLYIFIIKRANLYDVSNTAIDSMFREQSIGYISFDFKYRYLGSNDTARKIIPELYHLAVDDVFGYKQSERKVRHFLDSFKHDNNRNSFIYSLHDSDGDTEDEKIYNVNVNYLYDGAAKRGYIVTFTDDTANKKYIRLLDNYNEKLQEEVEAKTKSVIEMHDNLIMSLAMMVESRDNSTGGHIRRTSDGVRILIDEIKKEGTLQISDEFCKDVIKAAPMHDLGKIAVDDAILRKPGRFTDEEFEKMKHHASEGARVIHEILLHTDDESFKIIAENVAHYHHERWDGSGYPEGLKGEQIPLEARIMAIADVYDALVSQRVYKEAYDMEIANKIITEGMGSQFDPALKNIYEKARPRLEEYYKKQS